jgi:predicted TPR repeat methyltransferase
VALSDPRPLTVGGAPAVEIIATVTGIAADKCTAPKALHVMVATTVPGQPGTVLYVMSMAQDYAGAPDAGLVDQLVATLRRAG